MTTEETRVHTRLLNCGVEVDDSRAYWARTDGSIEVRPQEAFEQYWFGARSLARVKILLTNLRARFDAFPSALRVLHGWRDMGPDTRTLICHWHLQLVDPLYRAFTGAFLIERRAAPRAEVTRDVVVSWVARHETARWSVTTQTQFATNLLSASHTAGLVGSRRDPRPVVLPRVPDDALEYVLYLLRETRVEGTLLANAYLRSVGLEGPELEDRLRRLPALQFRRHADLIDFGWGHASLEAWAAARQRNDEPRRARALP